MAGFCIQERGDVDLMWILDLILTNVPHKQTDVGVFANDLSAIATCRDIKLLKSKPRLISKRDLKHSQEQAFLHDLAFLEWKRGSLFNDVEQAWNFFHNEFLKLINMLHIETLGLKGEITLGFQLRLAISKTEMLPGPELGKLKQRLTGFTFVSFEINALV